MELRAEVRERRHLFDGFRSDVVEFEGADADPVEPHAAGEFDGVGEVLPDVRAVAAEVDADEDDFPVAGRLDPAELRREVFEGAGTAPPAGSGDDAVGTAAVAAVLDLDERPGPAEELLDGDVLERLVPVVSEDVEDFFRHLFLRFFGKEPVHVFDDLFLVPDPGDDVGFVEGRRLVGVCLDHAAAEDDAGVGGHAAESTDSLAGLLVGYRCHGAGVDDIDIGALRRFRQSEAGAAELLRQRFGVVFVHFAAEGMEIDLHVLTAFPGL